MTTKIIPSAFFAFTIAACGPEAIVGSDAAPLCISASDCPNIDTRCLGPVCVDGACDSVPARAGMVCGQDMRCNGFGSCDLIPMCEREACMADPPSCGCCDAIGGCVDNPASCGCPVP